MSTAIANALTSAINATLKAAASQAPEGAEALGDLSKLMAAPGTATPKKATTGPDGLYEPCSLHGHKSELPSGLGAAMREQARHDQEIKSVAERARALGIIPKESEEWLTADPLKRSAGYIAARDKRAEEIKVIVEAVEAGILELPQKPESLRRMLPSQIAALREQVREHTAHVDNNHAQELQRHDQNIATIEDLKKSNVMDDTLAEKMKNLSPAELEKILADGKFVENARLIDKAFKSLSNANNCGLQGEVAAFDNVRAKALELLMDPKFANDPMGAIKSAYRSEASNLVDVTDPRAPELLKNFNVLFSQLQTHVMAGAGTPSAMTAP